MPTAIIPDNESQRLMSLIRLGVLDTPSEPEFDALVKTASLVCGVPISAITLIDQHRQWFKASVGLEGLTETPRGMAFCSHAILTPELMEVPDALLDPRFAGNPLVLGAPLMRFYAGMPLLMSDGMRIGTLCVIDRVPRSLSDLQKQVLSHLSQVAVRVLEGRLGSIKLINSEMRLQNHFKTAPVMLHSIDVTGSIITVSDRWLETLGYGRDEVIGRMAADFMTEASRHKSLTSVLPAFFKSGSFNDEAYQLLTKSGEVIEVRMSGVLERDSDGLPVRGIVVVNDVSTLEQALQVAEGLLGTIRSQFIMSITDAEGNIVEVNDAFCAISGYERAALIGKNHRIVNSGYHSPDFFRAMWQDIASGRSWRQEICNKSRNGTLYWVDSVITPLFGRDGKIERYISIRSDITDKVQQRAAIAATAERMTLATNSGQIGVWDYDLVTGVLTWDALMYQLFGLPKPEPRELAVPANYTLWSSHVHPDDLYSAEQELRAAIDGTKNFDTEFRCVWSDGSVHHIRASAVVNRDEQGVAKRVVGVNWDVTEQRRLIGEMTYRATHDMLTSLFNRAEFEHCLRRTLALAHDEPSEHALLYIDLDQFKLVNDTCGHTAGDRLLQEVSHIMVDVVRSRDTLARIGGDEFAIILRHCKGEQAMRVAQKICDRINEFRFVHDEKRFRIGASIGLVPLDNRWNSIEALMQAADTSCYAAKDAGRNRVHAWFDTDLAIRARHGEMQWATRLEQAIDEDRFVLYGQCIYTMGQARYQHRHAVQHPAQHPAQHHDHYQKQQKLHVEVLLRMLESDGTIVLPGAFLPAAERFHLASRIDRWVLMHALEQLKNHADLNAIELLTINLSGHSVGDRAFHRHAMDMLMAAGSDVCQRICFEITETAAITHMANALRFIEQVHALGAFVALDDFGAGASSFGYLKSFEVDILKIDGQFIQHLPENPLDDVAVRCFVDVARVVKVRTVAEYVESTEVLDLLHTIGVDYAQGFLLHRPEPLHQVLALTDRRHSLSLQSRP